MMQEVLLREGILLWVKSSRLLHQESQLKNWKVLELQRIIRRDMKLYTIGKISERLVFSFSIYCISIILSLTVYTYLKKQQQQQVVTALYSFLFYTATRKISAI